MKTTGVFEGREHMATWVVVIVVALLWATYSCLGWLRFVDWRSGALRESGVAIARLTRIRQRARTGTKGYVNWRTAHALPGAIWIPYRHPLLGSFLMVSADSGQGPHHSEQVAYVKQVHRMMLAGSLITYQLVLTIARVLRKLLSR